MVRHHLHDADPAVRAAALGALLRAEDLDATDLLEAADDPAASVRATVAELVARLARSLHDNGEPPGDGSGPPLAVIAEQVALQLLRDDDDRVAEVAAFALGELPLIDPAVGRHERHDAGAGKHPHDAPERVAALARVATQHRDSLCREAAVAALGSLGHPGGLEAILVACGDRAQVRRRAVLALAPFEGPEVTANLERLASDRDLQVSQAAEDLLGIVEGHET